MHVKERNYIDEQHCQQLPSPRILKVGRFADGWGVGRVGGVGVNGFGWVVRSSLSCDDDK